MKSLCLLILISLFPVIVFSQKTGSVKGRLTDSTAKQALPEATVSILSANDSSLVSYTLSDKNGSFEFKNISPGNYILIISFTSYVPYSRSFSVSSQNSRSDLGQILLQPQYKTLNGVIVSDMSPVKISGDTISYRSNAFKTKPDATVEDVLKKLPGVQVQKDGTIKTMGETVQKVYVDGKEFFGNDPKLATKNLTADMVDQIQVFDDMSEQSKFTRIDDGSRSKSINIKLKKDRKKGDFGRASAGLGTDSRYDGNMSLNHFDGLKRISVVGSANNTNKAAYTFNNTSTQGSSSPYSSGNSGFGNEGYTNYPAGVNSPRSGGINFNDSWNGKIDIRGSYLYTGNSNQLVQKKFRRNTFPGDSASEINSLSETKSQNNNHRVTGRFEYHIDSLNSLLYNLNLNLQQTNGSSLDTSFTVSDAVNKYLASTSRSYKKDNKDGMNYGGELLYRRKFNLPGRTFTFGWRNGITDLDWDIQNSNPATTYSANGSVAGFVNLDQQYLQATRNNSNSISASYTEPAGTNKLIELNYAFSQNKSNSDKQTFDYDPGTGKYDRPNENLSNYFKSKNLSSRVGANFRQQFKNYNYQAGMAVQFSSLENQSLEKTSGKDTTLKQRFVNFFPTVNFNYSISRYKSVRFIYRGRTNTPGIMQLQDVADVSDPLHVKTGNPGLKQEFLHSFNFNYNSFAVQSQHFFSANFNFNYTGNKIVNSIDSLTTAVLIIRPQNMNGSFNSAGTATLDFPVKNMKGANINLTNITYVSRDANLIYGKKNFTTLVQFNQSAGFSYERKNLEFSFNGGIVYNNVVYKLEPHNNNRYFSQAYSADLSYEFIWNIYLMTNIDYTISSGRAEGYNQDVFLWNAALAKKFLKNDAAEIKFTAFDILKQNKGINRLLGENYYEDIQANVIPQYFMLGVSYSFNRMKNNQQPKIETPVR